MERDQESSERVSLMQDDSKRPDGTTLLPWLRGKPLAWDLTVPDTYADYHVGNTATMRSVAAHKAAQNKTDSLANTHIFYLFAVETAGTWHEMDIELIQETDRRITLVTQDTRKTTTLFQRLSIPVQRGNAVSS